MIPHLFSVKCENMVQKLLGTKTESIHDNITGLQNINITSLNHVAHDVLVIETGGCNLQILLLFYINLSRVQPIHSESYSLVHSTTV